jgi:hypothetical protein
MQTQPALVASLVDNAVRLSATIGRVLLRLESEAHAIDLSGIEDEGPSTDALIDKARETAAEDAHTALVPPAFFVRRLSDITTRTWLQHARSSRRHPRPDVLGLTCRVLASTADPESYSVARFVVVLALRALYGVTYSNESLGMLREVYHDLDQRFRHQQARRFRKNPVQLEHFLLDLLFLDGRIRRTLSGRNLDVYYQSFSRYSLGVAPGGVRVFDENQKWPQIYGDLPELPSLLTLAFAQPFALDGLDEITGGLVPSLPTDHPSAGGGLVSLVVGPPGSGKTTFALSIATRMAALGSAVTYLTTEESESALRGKLVSSISRGPATWWPELGVTEQDVHGSVRVQRLLPSWSLVELAESLRAQFAGHSFAAPSDPALCLVFPRVLVIDSLTALMEVMGHRDVHEQPAGYAGRRRQLGDTLNDLRTLGVCVLMTGSLDSSRDEALEYLVDNVFVLDASPLEEIRGHQRRSLHVSKTRLQASYTGKHILHLSKERGLVVSPSLPTVLSEIKSRFAVPSDSETRAVVWAPSLQQERQITLPGIERPALGPVTVRKHAHTLLYGRGSTGKARLGMLLCLEPRVSIGDDKWADYVREYTSRPEYVLQVAHRHLQRTRVLVISFLYGRDYYHGVVREALLRHFRIGTMRPRRSVVPERMFSMLDLYPGLIDPETLVAKVRREVEIAKVAGRPYTAVLVDGVHNLVLQYPLLEREPLLWPCLYRLFRAEGLDVISTFTFFKVGRFDRRTARSAAVEHEVVHADTAGGSEHLFFHLLVSSSDHTFIVEGPSADETGTHDRNWVRVMMGSSIDGFGRETAAFWWSPEAFEGTEAVEQ